MKKLKILFVTEFYPPHIGGVETFFYELRKALGEMGHKVDVVTSAQNVICDTIHGEKKLSPKIESDDFGTVYRIATMSRYLFTFLAIPKVIKLAKSADIIHTTTYNAVLPAWIAAKIWRKKTVLSVHEVLSEDWNKVFAESPYSHIKGLFFKILEKVILIFDFDHTVAVSKFTQRRLPKNHQKKSSVIHHGIDKSFLCARKDVQKNVVDTNSHHLNGFEFLYFGRIAANKGFWFLLESLEDFFKNLCIEEYKKIGNFNNIKFKFILSGSESDFKNVEKFIHEKLHGKIPTNSISICRSLPRKELPSEILKSDAVIIPSLAEGFGFSAAESSALNMPVVASNAGSLPEVVSGKHLFFQSSNREDLIKKMHLALQNKWQYTKPKNFSWQKAAEEFEKIYKS